MLIENELRADKPIVSALGERNERDLMTDSLIIVVLIDETHYLVRSYQRNI